MLLGEPGDDAVTKAAPGPGGRCCAKRSQEGKGDGESRSALNSCEVTHSALSAFQGKWTRLIKEQSRELLWGVEPNDIS